jgi:hypothetical protein
MRPAGAPRGEQRKGRRRHRVVLKERLLQHPTSRRQELALAEERLSAVREHAVSGPPHHRAEADGLRGPALRHHPELRLEAVALAEALVQDRQRHGERRSEREGLIGVRARDARAQLGQKTAHPRGLVPPAERAHALFDRRQAQAPRHRPLFELGEDGRLGFWQREPLGQGEARVDARETHGHDGGLARLERLELGARQHEAGVLVHRLLGRRQDQGHVAGFVQRDRGAPRGAGHVDHAAQERAAGLGELGRDERVSRGEPQHQHRIGRLELGGAELGLGSGAAQRHHDELGQIDHHVRLALVARAPQARLAVELGIGRRAGPQHLGAGDAQLLERAAHLG